MPAIAAGPLGENVSGLPGAEADLRSEAGVRVLVRWACWGGRRGSWRSVCTVRA